MSLGPTNVAALGTNKPKLYDLATQFSSQARPAAAVSLAVAPTFNRAAASWPPPFMIPPRQRARTSRTGWSLKLADDGSFAALLPPVAHDPILLGTNSESYRQRAVLDHIPAAKSARARIPRHQTPKITAGNDPPMNKPQALRDSAPILEIQNPPC